LGVLPQQPLRRLEIKGRQVDHGGVVFLEGLAVALGTAGGGLRTLSATRWWSWICRT